MSEDWVVDILTDIRKFAEERYMLGLAEQLDDAILIAASEIRALRVNRDIKSAHDSTDRSLHREVADNDIA